MPSLPMLETSRLTLVPAREADHLDALWAHWGQGDVRRYLFDDEPVTRERAADALARCLADAAAGSVCGSSGNVPSRTSLAASGS